MKNEEVDVASLLKCTEKEAKEICDYLVLIDKERPTRLAHGHPAPRLPITNGHNQTIVTKLKSQKFATRPSGLVCF